jgi:hypothetical protein
VLWVPCEIAVLLSIYCEGVAMSSDAVEAVAGITNGWDAICALNVDRINSIFLQYYLLQGPTHPTRQPIRFVMSDGSNGYYVLDTTPGPPKIRFSADLSASQCQLTMYLTGGALTHIGDDLTVRNVVRLLPNQTELTGPVQLTKFEGTVTELGGVSLDLGSGAYTATVEGVAPLVGEELSGAVKLFFQENKVIYPFGTILYGTCDCDSTSCSDAKCRAGSCTNCSTVHCTNPRCAGCQVPIALKPRDFHFVVQLNPAKTGDGCVVLLIKTDGPDGPLAPLPAYPIPDGHTATVAVSNRVVFAEVAAPNLERQFTQWGTKFIGQQAANTWVTTGNGGTLDLGVAQGKVTNIQEYFTAAVTQKCQAAHLDQAHVQIPLNAFTIQPLSGSVGASWTTTWKQGYASYYVAVKAKVLYGNVANMKLTLQVPTRASVNKDQMVTFSGAPSATVTFTDELDWVDEYLGSGEAPRQQLQNFVQNALQGVFRNLQFPAISVFALGNVLFPAFHTLTLNEVAVPGDLLVHGQVDPVVQITPGGDPATELNLLAGQTQQFTATVPDQIDQTVQWSISPNVGSIDVNTGRYQAPPSIAEDQAVVITATSVAADKLSGRAMAFIYRAPSHGVTVNPASLTLPAGQSYGVTVAVTGETDQDVSWTITPPVLPQPVLRPGTQPTWLFRAPTTLTAPQAVTVTATSTANRSKSGSAVITVAPAADIEVTPATATLRPGQTQQFKATINGTPAAAAWYVYPSTGGVIDNKTGLYTAPPTVSTAQQVLIIALPPLTAATTVGGGFATVNLTTSADTATPDTQLNRPRPHQS